MVTDDFAPLLKSQVTQCEMEMQYLRLAAIVASWLQQPEQLMNCSKHTIQDLSVQPGNSVEDLSLAVNLTAANNQQQLVITFA